MKLLPFLREDARPPPEVKLSEGSRRKRNKFASFGKPPEVKLPEGRSETSCFLREPLALPSESGGWHSVPRRKRNLREKRASFGSRASFRKHVHLKDVRSPLSEGSASFGKRGTECAAAKASFGFLREDAQAGGGRLTCGGDWQSQSPTSGYLLNGDLGSPALMRFPLKDVRPPPSPAEGNGGIPGQLRVERRDLMLRDPLEIRS